MASSVVVLQLEVPEEPMVQLAHEARARHGIVVLKASPLPPHYVPKAEGLLAEGVDWLFLNEWEAPALLGHEAAPLLTVEQAEHAAEEALLRFPELSLVVITLQVRSRGVAAASLPRHCRRSPGRPRAPCDLHAISTCSPRALHVLSTRSPRDPHVLST